MTSTLTAVINLKEGDVIEGVGTVTGAVQFASGLTVDVNLDALDGKMASISWEPTWVGFEFVGEFAIGTGWSWPTVPVVN